MRRARAILIAILLVGTAMTAAAGDMVLTRNGELYRIIPTEEGLVASHRLANGSVAEYLIPQTADAAITSVQVGVDELTGALYVFWQNGEGLESSLEIAWLIDSTWSGPFVIAGADGTAAVNPQLLIDRFETMVEDDDGEMVEFAATFLHLAWWGFTEVVEDGSAFLASVTLDETGVPDANGFIPEAVRDLLPYGVGCQGISNAEGLGHPKIFNDPQTGTPHVFATDFSNCAFQIIQIDYEIFEEYDGEIKRRRAITVWRHGAVMAVNPEIVLANTKVEVGHGLDVVMYWSGDSSVDYALLGETDTPAVQNLPYGEGLSREQAIEVVRGLVH